MRYISRLLRDFVAVLALAGSVSCQDRRQIKSDANPTQGEFTVKNEGDLNTYRHRITDDDGIRRIAYFINDGSLWDNKGNGVTYAKPPEGVKDHNPYRNFAGTIYTPDPTSRTFEAEIRFRKPIEIDKLAVTDNKGEVTELRPR